MVTILTREIPNKLDELTIEQFEKITSINNDQGLDPIDKHLRIFEYLGVPESEFWDHDTADFIELVKQFNTIEQVEYPTVDTLQLDGYTYKAEMKLTVRDAKLIEKIAIHKEPGYISDLLAVMFKREDLSNVEHYTDAHLKVKAKLLKQVKAEVAIPYIMFIAQKIAKQVDEPTQAVA